MQSVCIIVLNWNGWKDTIECVESIQRLRHKNFKLKTIIVDNASTNESVEKISQYISNLKNISLIINKENMGFAGGNNVGIRNAVSENDYIMILNNDTLLEPHILENLVSFSENDKNVGALSPKMYFSKGYEFHKERYNHKELGKVVWYMGGKIDWKNVYGSNFGVDEVDRGQFKTNNETDFGSGACLFLRSDVVREVGMFDEKYFLYFEDTDLCVRIKRANYKVYVIPSAILWHKVSQASAIGGSLNDYFITRNRLLFGFRYANLRAKAALLRESVKFLISGRVWQRRGVIDFYLSKFGKGSFVNT